jgi:hypothetical protein
MRKIELQKDRRGSAALAGVHGLSMAEFCRRRDLPYATVASWRNGAHHELVLPGGTVLRVYQIAGAGGAS